MIAAFPSIGEGQSRLPLQPVGFDTLRGWPGDDHAASFAAFRKSCAAITKARTHKLAAACASAAKLGRADRAAARRFFEEWFQPHIVRGGAGGFLTGYYEPELNGSRTRGGPYQVPVYGKPKHHVAVTGGNRPRGFPSNLEFARATGGGLAPFPPRREIEQGVLADDPSVKPILWLDDWVDAFFMHVQGSGRVRMDDGSTVRLSFAAKSGYPYTSIGKVLVDAGELQRDDVTMETIKAWLRADPERGRQVMWRNQSYIFFRELPAGGGGPVGGQGVTLTPGRSLAVDKSFHTLGTPVFVESDAFRLAGAPPSRLMIAQDVGSAIKGPQRGDIFWGSGPEAGRHAGVTKHPGRFVLLLLRRS